MGLAVVRSLGTARRLRSPQELEDFEQELVDQYALAVASWGATDHHVAHERSVIQELLGHEWLSTTTPPEHVHADHIEHAWAAANQRVAARLAVGSRPRHTAPASQTAR